MEKLFYCIIVGLIVVIAFLACWIRSLKGENIELKQHAFTDDLTGLKNQRYFYEFFIKEVKFARRHNLPISVVIIDLDNFKSVNDIYGHATGDEYLKEVAKTLRRTAKRAEDHIVRYGGDEFIIILPGTVPRDAQHIAKRVKAGIVSIGQQLGLQIETSASIGVSGRAEWRSGRRITNESEMDSLFKEADAAMYKQKDAAKMCRLQNEKKNQG